MDIETEDEEERTSHGSPNYAASLWHAADTEEDEEDESPARSPDSGVGVFGTGMSFSESHPFTRKENSPRWKFAQAIAGEIRRAFEDNTGTALTLELMVKHASWIVLSALRCGADERLCVQACTIPLSKRAQIASAQVVRDELESARLDTIRDKLSVELKKRLVSVSLVRFVLAPLIES